VLQTDTRDQITVADATGRTWALPKNRLKSIQPTTLSLMPEGLDKALTAPELKDLMTFLLTTPLEPASQEIQGAPPPRKRAELETVFNSVNVSQKSAEPPASPFNIVLCAGPKDHGPGEHDYPLWQKRWAKLLALAEEVTISTAWEWPSAAQWQTAQVIVFYSDNPGWNAARASELEAFISRGGGVVFIHWAVDGHQEVEALASSTRDLASSLQEDEVLPRIVAHTRTLTNSDLSYIAVREGSEHEYRVRAESGARTEMSHPDSCSENRTCHSS
jgi:hypothetical protein